MISKIRTEAISVFISGFDIFIPKKNDQILLLECLINKKKSNIAKMKSEERGVLLNNSSIIDIINNISTEGLNELLLAVLHRMANPVIAWNSLHPSLQRNTNSSLSFSTTIKTEKTTDHRKTNRSVTGSTVSSILPVKIGDVVIRGNDWMYEQQDKDVRAHDGGRAELSDVSVGYIMGVSLWDPMAVIQSPGASSFSPMQNDRGRPWDLNTGIGIDIGKGDDRDREKEKGGLVSSATATATTNEKKQEGGLRDLHHRAEHSNADDKNKDKDKDEEEEGERGGLCVTVQWTQGGGVNTYRWGVPIDNPLNPSLPPSPVSSSTNPISLHINTNDRITTSTSTQATILDRYYDVKILVLDSEPVEVRRQAQVRTFKHAPQQREVLKYTPGQVHDSLVRGMGDLQAGDVLQYVRDRERMALSTATTVAVATTSSTPTTATASAVFGVTGGTIGQTVSDAAAKGSTEVIQGEKTINSTGNLISTKDIVDKFKDIDKLKDDNNKDKDEDKNASLRSSWTPVEIHQIYENYFSRNGIILPVDFSMFTSTSVSNVLIQRDTMSDTFSRLMISLTQLIEAIHVSQTIIINTENIQNSEMKEIGDMKNAQNTDNSYTNNTDMNINSKIIESAQRALLIFQGLIIGSGESPAGKNLLKVNVRANDMKNRLANKEFFGSEKVPLKWNWLEGFWNYYSKDSDRKKNHDNTIVYEKGNEYIVTNLLFDSTCVPESLLLSESNRTVHQRWNKRWGSAVGNIVLHPNTGEVMKRMTHDDGHDDAVIITNQSLTGCYYHILSL